MSRPVLLSPIYPTVNTPALIHSPTLPPMDASDCSSDDGDHLHTPLQLPDSNTTIASHSDRPFPLSSSSSNESADFFDFSQSECLHSSPHVTRPTSPFFPSEYNSQFKFSAQLSSPHPQPDLSHNALQLDSLTSAYQSDLSSQNAHFSLPSSCESTPAPHEELLSIPFPLEPCASSPSHTSSRPRISHSSRPEYRVTTKASAYSRRFPRGHHLSPEFVQWYKLGDELGAGGYGFVMTALHRLELREVAVKFIIKAKVPDHAWMKDKASRRIPTEALLLGLLDHPNIVKCIDLFEDELYFCLVSIHKIVLCAGVHTSEVCHSFHRFRNFMVLRGYRRSKIYWHPSRLPRLERHPPICQRRR
jgi:hypothetical protein